MNATDKPDEFIYDGHELTPFTGWPFRDNRWLDDDPETPRAAADGGFGDVPEND